MKSIYYLLVVFVAFAISNCGKENEVKSDTFNSRAYYDSVIQYLKSRLSKEDFAYLDITSINAIKYKETTIAVKILEKGSNGQRFILLHKSLDNFDGNRVDLSNLARTTQQEYNGKIVLTTLENKPLNEFTVTNNRVVKVLYPSKEDKTLTSDNTRNSKVDMSTPENPMMLDEVIVIGYVSSADVSFMSFYWMFDADPYYENMYTSDFGGGGSNSNSSSVTIAPKFISPDHPTPDIKKELKCFTIDNKSTYSVTINVNQPVPNSRDLNNLDAHYVVGHTYMTFEEDFSNGSSVIRNIGFYPATGAKPGSSVDKSVFGDDSNTPFTVSLKIYMTGNEFNTLTSTISNNQQLNFDLNNYNCTSSTIQTFNSVNIHLPSTKSDAPLYSGNNPADLGQDIRNLDLNKFSSENGGRKVIRNVSKNNANDINPPAKAGVC